MGSIANVNIVRKNGEKLHEDAISELKSSVKGKVVFKGEAEDDVYRAAIDRFNKAYIQEAAIIVFCESDEDVAAALLYVQKWNLDLVISCGRHSYYGASSTIGGLVIDLRMMRKVTLNIEERSATAQGGCKAVDLEEPLAVHGFAVVMGAFNDTGIGGLTLGGGSGFLSGQHGLVIDNLLAAKVVVADGRILRASEKENADLFWAIRGGGSNFGVVTEFTYRIHQHEPVFAGTLVFTPDKTNEFLKAAKALKPSILQGDGKLQIIVVFVKAPGMPSVHPAMLLFYDGPEEEARKLLAPFYELQPVADMTRMMQVADLTKPSPLVLGPLTHQHYSTSNAPMFDLDIDVIQTLIKDLDTILNKYGDAVAPSKIGFELRSYVKSSSVEPSATALSARSPAILTLLEIQHDGSIGASVLRTEVKSTMDKVRASVKAKHQENGSFSNTNIGVGTEGVKDIFGANLPRLRELKRKYDPNFVFNKWYPISPAEE